MRLVRVVPAVLAAALLWASPAAATSPALDTNANACAVGGAACPTKQFTGTSGATAGITSNGTSGCLVVLVSAENSGSNVSPSVSSVTGGSNVGTFTKRGTPMTGNSTGFFGAQSDDTEVWYAAFTAALSANVVTVTMSAATDGVAFAVLVVTGTFNGGCSWDSHAQNTAIASWTSGVGPSLTQVTNQADDFLFIFGAQGSDNSASSAHPSTFNSVGGSITATACEAAGARSTCQGTFFETVSATQNIPDAAMMINSGGTSFSSQGYTTVDALTADAPPSTGSPSHLLSLTGAGQ